MKLVFRGTGDAHAVPRLYCECNVCEEARATGTNRRYRSSAQLFFQEHETIWIDCGPDWYVQMEQAKQKSISHMFITHAHFDHIGGLPQWYDQARYINIEPKCYAAAEVIDVIKSRFPWLDNRVQFIELDRGISIDDWGVRAWKVNHGHNGYSYAFRFDHLKTGASLVYCPDCILLTEEQQQLLYHIDHLIIGASFYKEPYPLETRSLYDVTELLQLRSKWRPKQMWITHMSHDIDITKHTLPEHVHFARTGAEITL